MHIQRINSQNVLFFDPDTQELDFKPLNERGHSFAILTQISSENGTAVAPHANQLAHTLADKASRY